MKGKPTGLAQRIVTKHHLQPESEKCHILPRVGRSDKFCQARPGHGEEPAEDHSDP